MQTEYNILQPNTKGIGVTACEFNVWMDVFSLFSEWLPSFP